jgi:hypothetical protein
LFSWFHLDRFVIACACACAGCRMPVCGQRSGSNTVIGMRNVARNSARQRTNDAGCAIREVSASLTSSVNRIGGGIAP